VLPLFSAIQPPPGNARLSRHARPRFLFVGRVTASKGIVPLVEEFATLPEHELLVVGDGELRSTLERRFANCPNIRFLGQIPQSDLIPLYEAATALVFPSLAPETFGLSIVEAFACGTPAIVRDAGGCREPVDATGAGIVYRTNEELRQSVLKLGSARQLREQLGRRARNGFARLYTVGRHLDQYLGHIETIRTQKGFH
jgi:glycosyltransferase involved in cell wall biosynthesis